MRSSIEYESQVKASWFDCFKPAHKQLYRTLLMMTLQMFQQLTGANYFFYVRRLLLLSSAKACSFRAFISQYGATVFTSVGVTDPFVVQIILGAVNFGCTFGGLYIMEHVSHRLPFFHCI